MIILEPSANSSSRMPACTLAKSASTPLASSARSMSSSAAAARASKSASSMVLTCWILCASSSSRRRLRSAPQAPDKKARSITGTTRRRASSRPRRTPTSRSRIPRKTARTRARAPRRRNSAVPFAYRDGLLCAEQVSLDDIARRFGTPCFVYSRSAIAQAYQAFAQALQGRSALVCYSVKANSSLAILACLAQLGAGFDIVSGGELARVLAAGGDPAKVLFSGVGKSEAEIALALEKSIACINLESEAELERVAAVARRLGRRAPIAFRVNPDIDARTHPYISTGLRENKFGVPHADAERLYARAAAARELEVVGIGCHIGSQLADAGPFAAAVERLAELAQRIEARGIALRHVDVGGGMGIRYKDEPVRPVSEFVAAARRALPSERQRLILDPGRSIVGNAGALLTRVEYVKENDGHS